MRETRLPRICTWLFLRFIPRQDREYVLTGVEEVYRTLDAERGWMRARVWLWLQLLRSLPSFVHQAIHGGLALFKNYFKVALRNIRRHKGYAFVNITGLAVGMACTLFILLYVLHEWSFDKYHRDVDRVFRLGLTITTGSGSKQYAVSSPPAGPALKQTFPQVEYAARVLYFENTRLVRRGDVLFYEEGFVHADQDIFNVLTIPFLLGDPETSLDRPFTVVIPERLASKFYGDENPLGQTLMIEDRDYQVTGVVPDAPKNSHFPFDTFVSMDDLRNPPWMKDWTWPGMYTYVKLSPHVDAQAFRSQIAHFADAYIQRDAVAEGTSYEHFLQPITDIHLHSRLEYEIGDLGSGLYVAVFSGVGLFVLLIACMNFMNLTTARSAGRAREVAMRKTIGAERKQLIGQFLGETLIFAMLALVVAVMIVVLTKPLFTELAGIDIPLIDLVQPNVLLGIVSIVLIVGLAAGVYPAFVLSGFRPICVLKGLYRYGASEGVLRKILVVGQFSISIILMVGTLIMARQIGYMKTHDLGFDKEQKLVLPVRGRAPLMASYESVKDEFLKNPAISGAVASGSVPGGYSGKLRTRLVGQQNQVDRMMFYAFSDADFIPAFGLKMTAGRTFSKDRETDASGSCIINEAAVRAFGWHSIDEAIGQRLETGLRGMQKEIIGVVEDYHYRGLQYAVEPLVMEIDPAMFHHIGLTVGTENLGKTLRFIEEKWHELFPEKPFEYFFLDAYFARQYESETRIGRLFGTFTTMGLFIACLGLLGLASFVAEQRTKEIGIRKVLGASVPSVVFLFTKEFTRWVVLANGIAWPVAYLFMHRWLQNFAYRMPLGLEPFLLAGLSALVIALGTISFQSIKTALTDPVKSLRTE